MYAPESLLGHCSASSHKRELRGTTRGNQAINSLVYTLCDLCKLQVIYKKNPKDETFGAFLFLKKVSACANTLKHRIAKEGLILNSGCSMVEYIMALVF
jgi:hypothetical protein